MKDIISSILATILAVIMLGITPLYYVGIIQWTRSEIIALSETSNLIDEVIDTRELRESTLKEYNINLASTSEYYTAKITRQVRVINPDPLNKGKTYESYVTVDDISTFNQGDFIIVEVKAIGNGTAQVIAQSLLGLGLGDMDFTLAGRVR